MSEIHSDQWAKAWYRRRFEPWWPPRWLTEDEMPASCLVAWEYLDSAYNVTGETV